MLKVKLITITPELANQLLKKNSKNRPLNISRSKRLAEAIKRGEWQMNADTIRISETGVLLDGQHRLQAIAFSGIPVQALLVKGLPDDVFKTIDTNAKIRGATDILAINGEKNYRALAGAAKFLFIWQNSNGQVINQGGSLSLATPIQIQEVLSENPGLKNWVSRCVSSRFIKDNCSCSFMSFAFYVFEQKDAEKANSFYEKLITGAGLSQNCPILKLRDFISFAKKDRKQYKKNIYAAYVFKAFKLYLRDSKVKNFTVRFEGLTAEKNLYRFD